MHLSLSATELAFRDGVMDRIRLREARYDERAYLFVLAALEFCQQRLTARRHLTGRELAVGCRDLALQRYGVLARTVLDHWGVRDSADIGEIVFALVDVGLSRASRTTPSESIPAPANPILAVSAANHGV